MTDEELDVLMRRVLIDAIKIDEAEEDDSTINFEPSPQYQRQIKAMLKDPLGWARKKSRPIWKTVVQRVAMILLVISLGFGTLMITSPTARAAFIRWVTEWYETHVTYRYIEESTLTDMPRYEISDLPEGYEEYQKVEKSNYVQIIYQNDTDRKRIYLRYIHMQRGSAIDFVTDNLEVISLTVNGMIGELFLSYEPEKVRNTVTWIDTNNNLQFVLDAPFEKEEILRIAESVVLEK